MDMTVRNYKTVAINIADHHLVIRNNWHGFEDLLETNLKAWSSIVNHVYFPFVEDVYFLLPLLLGQELIDSIDLLYQPPGNFKLEFASPVADHEHAPFNHPHAALHRNF